MREKRCRWGIYLAVGLLAGLMGLWNTGTATAQDSGERPLKVAFPELEGLSETDRYGCHKGLIVNYLDEIAKYTGWEYEYVPVANDDMVSNLSLIHISTTIWWRLWPKLPTLRCPG